MTSSGGVYFLSVVFFVSVRSLLLLVMSSVSCRVQAMVHRPVEPLNHTIPAGGSQRWHQGVSTALQSVQLVLKKLLISCNHIFSKCLSGPWSEGGLGGPSGMGERDPSLARCTTRPVKAVSPTSA